MNIFPPYAANRESSLALVALLLATFCVGQTNRPSTTNPHAPEFTLRECEGIDDCAPWHFIGNDGMGRWKNGETANLRITDLKQVDNDTWSITIHRVDLEGTMKGYTADYHGKLRKNGRIGGEYNSTSNGQEGDWYAIPEAALPTPALPSHMHFCDVNCLTLELRGDRYIATNDPAKMEPGWSETFVIKKFTRESVVLERTLTGNPYHFTVTYDGQVSPDNNSIVNAKNPFCCSGNQPQYASFVWGNLINTIPGDYISPGPRQTTQLSIDQDIQIAGIVANVFESITKYCAATGKC
jgi:hypothetical protein